MSAYLNKSTLVLFFIGLIGLFFCIQAYYFPPHDFSNYYFGGYFYRTGNFSEAIYYPHYFNQAIADLGQTNVFVSYAPNTPFLAQFFVPFSWMSLTTAKLVFNLMSLGLFLFSLRKLMQIAPINPLFFALIPLVFFIPLQNNFLFGQVYLLLFFLISEGFMAYRNENYWKLGLFWGVAILLKLTPIFLIFWFVIKQKWKPLFVVGLASFLLLTISVLLVGMKSWIFYLDTVLVKSGAGEITTEFVQNYQSMHMFLKGFFVDQPNLFAGLIFGYKLLIFSIAILISIREKNELKLMGLWLMVSFLISPYGSTYGNILLIFLFIASLILWSKQPKKIGLATLLFLLVCNLPIHFFSELSLPFSFPRLALLLLMFLVFAYHYLKNKWFFVSIGIIIPLALIKGIFLTFPQKQDPFLIENQPLLILDYENFNGKLVFTYWTEDGINKEETEIVVNSLVPTEFNEKDNLLQPTTSFMKPAILNDTTLIFLSDEKRGIGFHALHFRSLK